MSWDVFVQDLPRDAKTIDDVAKDFAPGPLPCTRTQVIAAIADIVPFADFSDPAWGKIDDEVCQMDVNLGNAEALDSFAFHVYGGSYCAVIIAQVLQRLGLRALDPQSDTGFFEPGTSSESFERWRRYRDQVTKPPAR